MASCCTATYSKRRASVAAGKARTISAEDRRKWQVERRICWRHFDLMPGTYNNSNYAAIIGASIFGRRFTMRLALLAACLCTLLYGCGQKGPLFIPSDDTPPSNSPSQPQ
jgi:predicted small lipoprotein YifL